MEAGRKAVASFCIFSTLLLGCSGSMTLRPEGDDKQEVYTHEIEYVITKEGAVYTFEKAPTATNDLIVGEARVRSSQGVVTRQVSIPFTDVEKVSLKGGSMGGLAIGLLAVLIIGGIVVVSSGGMWGGGD